jgi:hypothetical protein
MNPTPHPSAAADRVRKIVSLCLATSIAGTSFAQAPTGDALRRLQDENAALRRRLAELEGKAAPAPATQAPAASAAKAPGAPAARLTTDEGVAVLSPFQVAEDKDYGYLKTNSATATRIGMPIQKHADFDLRHDERFSR